MSYIQNAAANRDALFGSAGGGSSGSKKGSKASSRARASGGASTTKPATASTSTGYQYDKAKDKMTSRSTKKPSLTGEAKAAKMKEAEDYRDKAKTAMQRGLFSKPDPLASSTYYKRAADCYQLCGENRLERMYRISSADCQMLVAAYATAAAEYTRAAELLEDEDEPLEMKREIGRKLHLNASDAWRNMNEPAKAAASKVQAALALIWGDDSAMLPKVALEAVEESIEAHVPDPLNPYARYRQTGVSAFVDPNSDETTANPSPETIEFAKQHIVTRAYAHEPVQKLIYFLVSFGEYASALYAAGAASKILETDGISTLTLSRAFLVETILTLAMGDPILSEEQFLNRHVQSTSYLNSRECKVAEELFRAVKMRDGEALEEARSPQGSNRAALANLHESMRELVTMLRLSGVARKGVQETYPKRPKVTESQKSSSIAEPAVLSLQELESRKTGYEAEDAVDLDPDALQDELDALDFGDDSDLEDDDIDLR